MLKKRKQIGEVVYYLQVNLNKRNVGVHLLVIIFIIAFKY